MTTGPAGRPAARSDQARASSESSGSRPTMDTGIIVSKAPSLAR